MKLVDQGDYGNMAGNGGHGTQQRRVVRRHCAKQNGPPRAAFYAGVEQVHLPLQCVIPAAFVD